MYRALLINNAIYLILAILLIAIGVKLWALRNVETADKTKLFFNSFFFYSKPALRNMVNKKKQEYLRYNNKVNKAMYVALLGVFALRIVMGVISA